MAKRFGVLPLRRGYAVYDLRYDQIVNGVFYGLNDAIGVADLYEVGNGPSCMAPNAAALGLLFPSESQASD